MVGLGGAGQRHLRVFRELMPKNTEFLALRANFSTPLLNSDFSVDPNQSIDERYGIRCVTDVDEAFEGAPDISVIANPTSLHARYLDRALRTSSRVLVEKPLGAAPFEIQAALARSWSPDKLLWTGYQRRFHPLMRRLKEALVQERLGSILSVDFHTWSDMRRWHPYEDWRNLYAANAKLGGGALLTECHEFDLALWFFGIPEAVSAEFIKAPEEALDVEAGLECQLMYPRFQVKISTRLLSSQPRRSISVQGSKSSATWSEEEGALRLGSWVERWKPTDPDEIFRLQAGAFLGPHTRAERISGLNQGWINVTLLAAARESAASGKLQPPLGGGDLPRFIRDQVNHSNACEGPMLGVT